MRWQVSSIQDNARDNKREKYCILISYKTIVNLVIV